MENSVLQSVFIFGILCFQGIIIYFLRKAALSLRYSLLWLFSTFIMLLLCIFPNILDRVAKLLGFALSSNALFSLLLGFVIVILLQLTSIVSRQSERIKTLVQKEALLENRIRKLEEGK